MGKVVTSELLQNVTLFVYATLVRDNPCCRRGGCVEWSPSPVLAVLGTCAEAQDFGVSRNGEGCSHTRREFAYGASVQIDCHTDH